MVCTKEQVRILMREAKRLPLTAAAAKAGMSLSSAKRYLKMGGKKKECRPGGRTYRTREDPFADVWDEVRKLLEQDSGLEARH